MCLGEARFSQRVGVANDIEENVNARTSQQLFFMLPFIGDCCRCSWPALPDNKVIKVPVSPDYYAFIDIGSALVDLVVDCPWIVGWHEIDYMNDIIGFSYTDGYRPDQAVAILIEEKMYV